MIKNNSIQTIFLLFCCLSYILVRLGRESLIELPEFINSYLSDFVCLPIVLHPTLILVRKLRNKPDFTLTIWAIFGSTLYFSLLFEFILPAMSNKYTQDNWDIFFYFNGALLYYVITKQVRKNLLSSQK